MTAGAKFRQVLADKRLVEDLVTMMHGLVPTAVVFMT